MAKKDDRKLICTACQHANEIERVYCHNCGEKLDRSILPKLDEAKEAEDLTKENKRVKRIMNPNRFNWKVNLNTFIGIEALAVSVAAVFLAVQAPDFVPPMKTDRLPDNPEVHDYWKRMMEMNSAAGMAFKEFDVNHYLRKAVKGEEGPLGTKFERVFAHFEPGAITVTSQRDLWGLTIYNGATFLPTKSSGTWDPGVQKISIGRLRFSPDIAKVVKLESATLTALGQVFAKELKQVDRLIKIEPGPGDGTPDEGVVTLATGPATAPLR